MGIAATEGGETAGACGSAFGAAAGASAGLALAGAAGLKKREREMPLGLSERESN